jgi:two-component system, cell cycle sensor histidine kinase PleC
MALDALHDSFFDIHSLRGGYRWNLFASLNRTSREQAWRGAPPSHLGFVAIAAGLTALVLLVPVLLGSAPAHPEARVAFLFMAAASFLACGIQMQRASARAIEAERLLTEHRHAIQASGGVVLRWQLVNGDLVWSGNPARLLGISSGKVPSSFRDLRSYLHPDDCLYNEISRALRTSQQQVCWPVRIRDPHKGWKAFTLKGEIGRNVGSGHPEFAGALMPADPPAPSSGEDLAQRLTRIVESLPISVAIWDRQNRLMLCNRKFRQLYRIVGASALRSASFEEVQVEAREPIAQHPTAVPGSAGSFHLRDQQLESGTWLQIGEYWTSDGTLVSVGTDITVSKDSERQVLEREQEMRAKVDDFEQSRRQLEIQARQLRELAESYNEEKIRAEAANQAKSEFLANVSHELRTPLNAIIGFSEMMRDGVLGPIGNPKYESYVKDIYASGRYLLEMINDILDMSKIEAGRMTLSPEWVALNTIVEECLTVVHPSAVEGKVDLIQCGSANISVFADKRALKQVLINLLSNAIKFTPAGGKVVLRAYRYRGSLRIAIADTGVGIAKHEIGRLGKPFEQVGNQLTKGHKGTGLGLAISRSLVEMHGGKLDIKSRVGEGTTVTCILPLRDDKDADQEAA